MKRIATMLICLIVFLVFGALVIAQEEEVGRADSELAYVRIRERPNFDGSDWVYDVRTDRLVGYAPWDPARRRWTLFSLEGRYMGFVQATVGDDGYNFHRWGKAVQGNFQDNTANPTSPHFTQYLLYNSNNRYIGLFVRRLGGRPATLKRPDGELGGQLEIYKIGDIQFEPPSYQPEVYPLRKMMEGVDVQPADPLFPE
jgi:hypothetical protein